MALKKQHLGALLRDRRGASMLEYMIILGFVALLAMGAVQGFGLGVDTKVDAMAKQVARIFPGDGPIDSTPTTGPTDLTGPTGGDGPGLSDRLRERPQDYDPERPDEGPKTGPATFAPTFAPGTTN